MTFSVDTVSNFNTSGFIATAGTPKNITLASGESLLTLDNPMVFIGHIDSGNIIIDSLAPGYTDNGNDIGDVIIVKPTSEWGNAVADVLAVSLADDGTLNSTALTQIETGLSGASIRLAPRIRVQTTVDEGVGLLVNIDNYNYERVTAQGETLVIVNPAGTPNDGDGILFDLTATADHRVLIWGTDYVANSLYGLELPDEIGTKTTFITVVYNSTLGKWVAIL